jgi:hypothetical protein
LILFAYGLAAYRTELQFPLRGKTLALRTCDDDINCRHHQ